MILDQIEIAVHTQNNGKIMYQEEDGDWKEFYGQKINRAKTYKFKAVPEETNFQKETNFSKKKGSKYTEPKKKRSKYTKPKKKR